MLQMGLYRFLTRAALAPQTHIANCLEKLNFFALTPFRLNKDALA